MNYKNSLLIFFILSISFFVSAQEKPDKVPKQYSFEVGYRNIHLSTLDSKTTNGFYWMIDYAWQLTGMNGQKKKSFISVPIGVTYYYGNSSADTNMRITSYGWTVRHELAKDKKITPFMGYALLLNSMKRDGVKGGIMGHQTKFDVGINLSHGKRLKSFYKLEYCYTRFPQYNNKHSIHISAASINVGLRF